MTSPLRETPFQLLGGEDVVRTLATRFYDHMDASEPELARLHALDEQGRISARTRDRFTRFLMEWLGGPKAYSPIEGHPRLRMRHGHVRVDIAMRDAWLRCMQNALDDIEAKGDVRTFLDARFAEVADFLRNVPGE